LNGGARSTNDQGWQVNIHTIGDRANHVILDVIEGIAKEKGLEAIKGRFRLEHAQIMTLSDIKRAAELGGMPVSSCGCIVIVSG
jgi:predicted amidohydrolase YtcJ